MCSKTSARTRRTRHTWAGNKCSPLVQSGIVPTGGTDGIAGDHVHTVRANFYASNQGANEISFRAPIGLLQPLFDAGSEVLQASDDQEKFTSLRGQIGVGLQLPFEERRAEVRRELLLRLRPYHLACS